MQRRTLLIGLVIALGLGLAAGAVVMRQSARTSKPTVTKEPTVKIVRMKKRLTRGVKLKPGDFSMQEYPKRLVKGQFIEKIKEASDRVLLVDVFPGEFLLKDKLAEVGSKEGLSTQIKSGRRAFSIKVRDDTGVSGYLLPGSRVDVHVTLEKEVEEAESQLKEKTEIKFGNMAKKIMVTKTILQDVEVLAAGGEKEAGQKKSRITAKVVTLSLLPGESDRLALAASVGTIWLSIRNPRDKGKLRLREITIADLLSDTRGGSSGGSGSRPRFRRKKKEKDKKPAYVVEIIQGGKRTKVEF